MNLEKVAKDPVNGCTDNSLALIPALDSTCPKPHFWLVVPKGEGTDKARIKDNDVCECVLRTGLKRKNPESCALRASNNGVVFNG